MRVVIEAERAPHLAAGEESAVTRTQARATIVRILPDGARAREVEPESFVVVT
jgi:hypothetical protein